ncbi:hypothetical protein KIL84_008653 [Mauremys mutica]|uniref:Uncharacterized protein n=1 Tax=Mauremys mutica TaxID=74926 RepID=A0A9D3X871_9SAUR|nr:hypothetical protein KIL84_008653 [Mauremys mutica]
MLLFAQLASLCAGAELKGAFCLESACRQKATTPTSSSGAWAGAICSSPESCSHALRPARPRAGLFTPENSFLHLLPVALWGLFKALLEVSVARRSVNRPMWCLEQRCPSSAGGEPRRCATGQEFRPPAWRSSVLPPCRRESSHSRAQSQPDTLGSCWCQFRGQLDVPIPGTGLLQGREWD